MSNNKVKFICEHCGNDNISRDATAEWDIETQEWVLSSVQDATYCEDCDCEIKCLDVPLESWLIEGVGHVGADNAIWMHCEQLEARNNMTVGSTCRLKFKTGVGADNVTVTRVR